MVQEEHFLYLDRAPGYLCTSLKEKVWVVQGKGGVESGAGE